MNKIIRYLTLVPALLATAQAFTMEGDHKKGRITPENIASHMPQMPREQAEMFDSWAMKNQALLVGLRTVSSFRNDIAPKTALLQQNGITNLSSHNFTFVIRDNKGTPPLKLSVPSGANRRDNHIRKEDAVLDYHKLQRELGGLPQGSPERAAKVQEIYSFFDNLHPTFDGHTLQGISKAAGYRKAHHVQQKYNLDKVEVPETYLVQYPDVEIQAGEAVSDQTHFIAQQYSEDMKPLKFDSANLKELSSEQARQLIIMTRSARLWDINGNVGIRPNGNFVIHDTQQPNDVEPAKTFDFGKHDRRKDWALWAIRGFVDALNNDETREQHAAALEAIRNDKKVKTYGIPPHRDFYDVLGTTIGEERPKSE